MASSRPQKPIFLFTHPRTASNLLMQMLRAHPEIEPVEYPFIDTYYFGQEPMTVRSNDRFEAAKQRLRASPLLAQNYQAAFDELEQAIRKAEGVGKTAFIKEHAFCIMKPGTMARNLASPRPRVDTPRIAVATKSTDDDDNDDNDDSNPTVLPTQFLRSVTPVFLIRHPALVFESILRVSGPTMGAHIHDDEFPVDASLRWLRVLYDWFANTTVSRVRPIVVNADEIMARPTSIMQGLCERLQLDPAGVRFEWEPVPQSVVRGQSSYQWHFFSTIQSSCGVSLAKRSAAQGQALDLDVMTEGWQKVYGLETAAALRSFVDAAMEDYEYLCRCEMRS